MDADKVTRSQRAQATECVLQYLRDFTGQTWQERWDASPIGRGQVAANTLGTRRSTGVAITPGVRALYCLRVIQPTLVTFRRNVLHNFAPMFVAAQDDPLLDKYAAQVQAQPMRHVHRREAMAELCTLLAVQGVALSDVTPAAVLHFTQENRRARSVLQPGNKVANRLVGQGMWNVLHAMGHFPPATPPTLRAALMRGQRTVEEMVAQYPIRNQAVRALLIDYFTRRRADTDYSTLKNLVLLVAHHFWEKIERVNPNQADLRISPEHYATWRQMITVKDNGKPRAGQDSIIIAVRSFYFDLHTWAAEEPERWAAWVAPCPVPPSELHGLGTRRRRINERSANRTRQRQPLLPALVDHVRRATTVPACCWSGPTRQRTEKSSPMTGPTTAASSPKPTASSSATATRSRPASSKRPAARSSTSEPTKKQPSGSGPQSRPCGTPECGWKNSSSSPTSAFGNTSGQTERSSHCW
nr:hypothetical protein [Streptomyces sp. MST-110588]